MEIIWYFVSVFHLEFWEFGIWNTHRGLMYNNVYLCLFFYIIRTICLNKIHHHMNYTIIRLNCNLKVSKNWTNTTRPKESASECAFNDWHFCLSFSLKINYFYSFIYSKMGQIECNSNFVKIRPFSLFLFWLQNMQIYAKSFSIHTICLEEPRI